MKVIKTKRRTVAYSMEDIKEELRSDRQGRYRSEYTKRGLSKYNERLWLLRIERGMGQCLPGKGLIFLLVFQLNPLPPRSLWGVCSVLPLPLIPQLLNEPPFTSRIEGMVMLC
jgi:hypothetical protein